MIMTTIKKRILIIDDEVGFTWFLKMNLENTGQYHARVENNPLDALHATHEFHPDLILLDVMMPGMEGGDLGARLKADPLTSHIPILFVTAAVEKQQVTAQQGVIGGLHFVAKPVDFANLLVVIDNLFKGTLLCQ